MITSRDLNRVCGSDAVEFIVGEYKGKCDIIIKTGETAERLSPLASATIDELARKYIWERKRRRHCEWGIGILKDSRDEEVTIPIEEFIENLFERESE